MASATSFQRKTRAKFSQIRGVKPSLQNNQLLVSTGVPSFDGVIGGGIAVGSVVLVEEDTYGSYSKLLLKYFLAEGVMCGHALHVSSAHVPPANLLQELPGPVRDEPLSQQTASSESDSLQIAWRYQNMPKVQGGVSSKFGHYYDLTKTMPAKQVEETDKTLFDYTEMNDILGSESPTRYIALLQSIQDVIQRGQFSTSSTPDKRNVLRIGGRREIPDALVALRCIHSLGSPLWGENGGVSSTGTSHDPALLRFLIALRSLLRSSYSVCLLTIPTHLFQELSFTWRVEKLCDTVVALQSFAGSDKEKNPVFKEYHGLFNIRSLPHLNSLNSHVLDTVDWAFKLKRKKFTIEKLHLPPELSETVSRTQEESLQSTGCGTSTGKSKLDF